MRQHNSTFCKIYIWMSEHNEFSAVDMQRYESAMSWRAHDGEVYSVEFSYDENTVFSIGEDGKVCFFILLKTLHGFLQS